MILEEVRALLPTESEFHMEKQHTHVQNRTQADGGLKAGQHS